MILYFPVTRRAILKAASFASVPLVVKKNFSSPLGMTSRRSFASSARTSQAKAGERKAIFRACSAIDSMTALLPCPRFEHMSWLEKSRYFFPFASVKWHPSMETTWSGLQPFWNRQVP